jgi:hypothetical protein
MPDLDLMKQVEQGDASGSAGPIRRSRAGRRRLQPTRAVLLLICCRGGKGFGGASLNGCGRPRLASDSEAISGRRALDRSRLLRRTSAPRNDCGNLVEICFSQSKAGPTTVRSWFAALALDDAAPQQACVAGRVVKDAAGGVEGHRRAIRCCIASVGRTSAAPSADDRRQAPVRLVTECAYRFSALRWLLSTREHAERVGLR